MISGTEILGGLSCTAVGVLTVSSLTPYTLPGYNMVVGISFNHPANLANQNLLNVEKTDTYIQNDILINGKLMLDIHNSNPSETFWFNYQSESLFLYVSVDAIDKLKLDGTDTITFKSGFTTPLGDTLATDTTFTYNGTAWIPTNFTSFGSYKVSRDNIISNIQPGTTLTTFENALNPANGIDIAFTNVHTDNGTVGTGTNVTITVNGVTILYTLGIFGDVNGDGFVDIDDLVSIRDNILETEQLEGLYKTAGDLYGENDITLNALVGIMAFVSEAGDINQAQKMNLPISITHPQPSKISASAASGWDFYGGGGYEYSPSIIINDDDSIDAWFPSPGQEPAVNLFTGSTYIPVQISGTQTAAQKFTARWSFCEIQVGAVNWLNNNGNLTLKLYKWNTNYNTTIAGTAIAARTFSFISSTLLMLDVETQDAGDYLWVVSDPIGTVGLYKSVGSQYQGNVNYFNDSVVSDDYIFTIYDANNHYANNSATAVQITGTDTAAQKFVSNNEFVSISVQAPSWVNDIGNLTFSLYKWNTDYNTTIAGTVIASKTFIDYVDNSYLMLNFDKQAVGTYMWVTSNPTETVGLWKVTDSSFTGNVNYFNGSVVSGDYKTRVYETNWDVISYKHSVDGGHTWTQEAVVLKPTPGSADLISCCDPGVVKIGSYYYLGYSSTADIDGYNDHVFISRSTSPTGPFEKWNGSSWGGSTVSPLITYNGSATGWGAGEPSFVLMGSTIYIYYTWRDINNVINSTKVATANANDANWPSTIVQQRTIITKPNDSDQLDIKYIDAYGKFIGVSTGNRISSNSHIEVYESIDGLYFYPAKTSVITTNIQAYCHNVGISGNSSGHINLADNNFIVYAYGLTWGNWPTRLSPLTLTQYSGADNSQTLK